MNPDFSHMGSFEKHEPFIASNGVQHKVQVTKHLAQSGIGHMGYYFILLLSWGSKRLSGIKEGT